MAITEEQFRELLADPSLNITAIAKKLDVNECTVHDWKRRFGIDYQGKYRSGSQKFLLGTEDLRKLAVDQKMTDKAIAQQLGVCSVTVLHWRQRYGIPNAYTLRQRTNRQKHLLDPIELRRMYIDEKNTMAEMAEHFGCGESTVRTNLIRCGLQLSEGDIYRRRIERTRREHPQQMEHRGYRSLRMPDHPAADKDGYVLEHRYVAEQAIGRALNPGEQVHHINLQKRDNRAENLAVLPTKADHARVHKYVERVAVYLCGLTNIRPEPVVFGIEVFWGGRYVRQIDLIAEAGRSGQQKSFTEADSERGEHSAMTVN